MNGMETTKEETVKPPSYTIARLFAAGGILAAILAWPMWNHYGTVAGVSWLLVAVLGLFGAGYDQRVVRRSRERRRAYKRSQATKYADDQQKFYGEPKLTVMRGAYTRTHTPHSVIADLLIDEDHRRIRLAEENQA